MGTQSDATVIVAVCAIVLLYGIVAAVALFRAFVMNLRETAADQPDADIVDLFDHHRDDEDHPRSA